MPFASALSTATPTAQALQEVCAQCGSLTDRPDLAIVFFSPHHADTAGAIAKQLNDRLKPRALIGSIGEAIVGRGREVEHAPALSLWLGRWNSEIELATFHLAPHQAPDGLSLLGWPDEIVDGSAADGTLIVLGDPFTFPASEIFLPQINEDCRGLRVFGGMASGMSGPGETPLILGPEVHADGAVGILLRGAMQTSSVVSQGCRPIGRPFVVTKAQDHHILELGGRPPLEQLRSVFEGLSARDRELFQHGPHLGLVVNEYLPTFGRGDFLVRNVYAIDRASGAMTITDRARVGQTVQFHVRDAETADEDLRLLLRSARTNGHAPQAALVFTCNGRGTRLFPAPHHDAGAIRDELGDLPLAGFFAAGELGPIGGRNFLHGFTASVVLFDDVQP
jgi:small ligand-binding sensory domain FIST